MSKQSNRDKYAIIKSNVICQSIELLNHINNDMVYTAEDNLQKLKEQLTELQRLREFR